MHLPIPRWNDKAVQALVAATPPRPGPVAFLDLAIIQAAVHEAVQAFEKRFEPYHVNIVNASGSPIAAVATAAHNVLAEILPDQAAASLSGRLSISCDHSRNSGDTQGTIIRTKNDCSCP